MSENPEVEESAEEVVKPAPRKRAKKVVDETPIAETTETVTDAPATETVEPSAVPEPVEAQVEPVPSPESVEAQVEPEPVAQVSEAVTEEPLPSEVQVDEKPKSKSQTKKEEPAKEIPENGTVLVPAKPKTSLFRKIFGWMLPKPKPDGSFVPEEVEPSEPQVLTSEELAMSPTRLAKEIAASKRDLKAVKEKIAAIEETVQGKSDQILTIDEEVQKLGAWQETISKTFVAKSQDRMRLELQTAKNEMEVHEAAVKNLKKLEPGFLLKLRLAFHKSLTFALVICGGLIAIASIIKFRKQLPRLDWLSVLYDPNLSGPILIGAITLLVGGAAIITRKAGKQKLSLSKIIWWTVGLLFIAFLIWDASQKSSLMEKYVNPWLDKHYWEILIWVGSVWVIWVASSLIVYYRNWSIFQHDVDEQINSLQAVIDGYVKTQQEIQRLNLLYKQTNDWFRILANALFRPWRVNPDWGTSKEFSKHYETFPFALRVAQALEGNDSRMAELERIIGGHLLKQGWRDKAFEDLVTAVGEDMGLPTGKFTVDYLDKDLPHQTNNARLLLSKYLEYSAVNPEANEPNAGDAADAGKATKLTNQYLVKVAKSRLVTLIEKTQSHAIATARPRVEQIIDDPIIALRSDETGIDAFDSSESWDDFLTDALGARTVDQFPLGVLTFSEAGRLKNLPSQVQSFVVVPKRLAKALPSLSSDSIQVVPLGDDKPHSVEIIARIDVVGPVEFNDLQVLSSNKVPAEPSQPSTKKMVEEEKL
jgi:uncharacterized cupredoxin-like copper-binding protein